MSVTTLSFRTGTDFAEQTKQLAVASNMSSSDYVREAVREKNERVLKDRMILLSKTLSERHRAENQDMDAATGDGLG
jgi:hypothetical protein